MLYIFVLWRLKNFWNLNLETEKLFWDLETLLTKKRSVHWILKFLHIWPAEIKAAPSTFMRQIVYLSWNMRLCQSLSYCIWWWLNSSKRVFPWNTNMSWDFLDFVCVPVFLCVEWSGWLRWQWEHLVWRQECNPWNASKGES